MKPHDYEMIHVGSPIQQVQAICGDPYEIRDIGNGREEYHYIHRIDARHGSGRQIDYFLTVSKGLVISKKSKEIKSSSDFNYN